MTDAIANAAMIEPFVRRLRRLDTLPAAEIAVLHALPLRGARFQAGADLVREHTRPGDSTLLIHGFASRYKVLRDGSRQITAIHISGDFVDLHSLLLKKMDHSVGAITECTVALVPHAELRKVTERWPHLTRLMWLTTLIDGAIHRQWLTAMGRRPAEGQLAHLLCELWLRLKDVHLAKDLAFELPMTQSQLADTLGLSAVHVNRVLQRLRADDILIWRDGTVEILDWAALVNIAEFDPTYLSLITEPR